jgi:hypothetical protein
LQVQATRLRVGFEVTCDGEGVVGHAGAALLAELADRLGLTAAPGWRTGQGQTRRHHHQVGRVLRDLVVMLADGGDCLSDLAVLRRMSRVPWNFGGGPAVIRRHPPW